MAAKKGSPVGELDDGLAAVLRDELLLIRDEIADQGRRVALSAGLLAGAGVLGLGAFGALTTAAIVALGRQDTARGALLMAACYGAGAGALAEAGVKRLGRVTPEAAEAIQQEVKEAAKSVRRAT
jgi:Putative Actinobacterial Holin-X, holin superfamily III